MKKLDDEIARELRRFGPAAGMPAVIEAWPVAVGTTIARNAWPARIARDGTLHVATSSSSWAFELGLLESDILRGLRSALGSKAPRSLRFAVGKLPEPDLDDESARACEPFRPSAEHLERGADIAAGIEHEELRKLVAKAAAQSLERAGSGRSF